VELSSCYQRSFSLSLPPSLSLSAFSLSQMLRCGSSSGAICLNYSQHLFPSLLSAICHQLDVKSQDPKVTFTSLLLTHPSSPVLHSKPILHRPCTCGCHLSQSEGLSYSSLSLWALLISHFISSLDRLARVPCSLAQNSPTTCWTELARADHLPCHLFYSLLDVTRQSLRH
jgi:hypothetical protein